MGFLILICLDLIPSGRVEEVGKVACHTIELGGRRERDMGPDAGNLEAYRLMSRGMK